MTTREQYKSRWQQLESEIASLQEECDREYRNLPGAPNSEEWRQAFNKYFETVSQPLSAKIHELKKEAERCRIRSLEKFYCNRHLYSDTEPFEVIGIVADNKLRLRSMNAVQTEESVKRLRESFSPGGFIGHFDNSEQEWVCSPDEHGVIVDVRQHKNGHFYEPNSTIPYVLSDKPIKFRDFNF